MNLFDRLLDIPSADADNARRRKLLNILLLGIAVVTLVGVLTTAIIGVLGLEEPRRIFAVVGAGIVLLFSLAIIFLIGRYWSGPVASILFLLLLTAIISFTDDPMQVANGRSLFVFAIPIMMASVLLQPYASFVLAGLSSLVILLISLTQQATPNIVAMLGFFVIALVAWLSSRSLENALTELRQINEELDQRVITRTQELAEVLARNQAILTSIADGVIVLDPQGRVSIANPAVGRLLGRPSEQLVGCDVDTLISPVTNETDRDLLIALFRGGELLRSPSVKIGWGKRTLSVSSAQVRDTNGGMVGTVAVFRDFTREAELDRMKSTLISVASHELRTPVTAILGYADMLKITSAGLLPPNQSAVIDRILFNCRRLSNLISNLLDQAQIEAGTMRLTMGYFSPTSLIEGLLASVGLGAQVKGLELRTHIADDVPTTLYGDAQRLQQVLINLVGNAIKFTEQGSILVRIYAPDHDHWAMAVTDTGRGIPEEARTHIFEPFRQVESSATRRFGGVGLGLFIVKQLVNLMGGEILLESEMGRGSTFTVILPVVPATEGETP